MARATRIIESILALGLGALFIYAAVMKIWRPDQFFQDILSYQLLGRSPALIIAYSLPPVELIAGLLILLRKYRRPAALAITAMMAVFIVALVSAWMRGLDISCGCFGKSEMSANYPLLLLRDIFLLLGGVFLMICPKASTEEASSLPR